MLVDALTDAVPLWYAARPLPRLPYTPRDAVWCTERLLDRIEEGGTEVARRLRAGDGPAATRRLRDDLVRLCTALHLLRGETRPRRADAVRGVLRSRRWDPATREALRWAARSFGVDGRDDEAVPRPPDGGVGLLIAAVIRLRELVEEDLWRLRSRDPVGNLKGRRRIQEWVGDPSIPHEPGISVPREPGIVVPREPGIFTPREPGMMRLFPARHPTEAHTRRAVRHQLRHRGPDHRVLPDAGGQRPAVRRPLGGEPAAARHRSPRRAAPSWTATARSWRPASPASR
jgi:hypothetical protein